MRQIEISRKLTEKFTVFSLEDGTCSDRATKYFIKNAFSQIPSLKKFPTFDEAKTVCKKNKNNMILLPHVHHLCAELELSPYWETYHDQIFSLENPPLFLAKNNSDNNKCCSIQTLKILIGEKKLDFVNAKNTQDAAKTAKSGKCSYCITNENGVLKNNLEVVKELKKMNIIWIPFSYTGQ